MNKIAIMKFTYRTHAGTTSSSGSSTARCMLPLLATLLATYSVYAADPVTPNAGSMLQQIQPVKPVEATPGATGLTIEHNDGTQMPPSAPFLVSAIQISGNTVFDTPTLHALVASSEGTNIQLRELDTVINRITDFYRSHGYALARALVPAQTIKAGVVQVMVIEGRYGQVKLTNTSLVKDALLQQTLTSLQSGKPVTLNELDRALLLANSIPGAAVNATMKPGETPGTSDLIVEATATKPIAGSVTLNNSGNRYTGKNQLSGTLNWIDPLHQGDILSMNLLSSGNDMNYASITYETLLNGSGTRSGGSASDLHYRLGDNLKDTDGEGSAQVGSLWIKHPFVRSPEFNFNGQLQFDYKQLNDQTVSTQTDRHLKNGTASIAGDWRDSILAGAVNAWSLSGTLGYDQFGDIASQQADKNGANRSGQFTKWIINATRLQNLGPSDALFLNLFAQYSDRNLDSAEKMVAGGPYTVRAYDMGVASGDSGVLGTIEWRHGLGASGAGQWQTIVFVDSEHFTIDAKPWLSSGVNTASLTGTGAGLSWTGSDQWHATLYIATPLGAAPDVTGLNKSVHVWAEVGKGF